MKKITLTIMVVVLSAGLGYAAGGKHHSSKGKGSTVTGSSAQGSATQLRLGR